MYYINDMIFKSKDYLKKSKDNLKDYYVFSYIIYLKLYIFIT